MSRRGGLGRAMNLPAHAFGWATKDPATFEWLDGLPPAKADTQIAYMVAGALALLHALPAALVAMALVWGSDPLADSSAAFATAAVAVLRLLGYTLFCAPVISALLVALYPLTRSRRRTEPVLRPRRRKRYAHRPFVVIAAVAWTAAVVAGAALTAGDLADDVRS